VRLHDALDVLLVAEVARDVLDVVAEPESSAAAASSFSGRRAARVSAWPSSPSIFAMAKPMPLEAPVTMDA
jgi:hypothetical protein